jgi:hypothetical protein
MLDAINYPRGLGAKNLPNTQHRPPTQAPILSYPVDAFTPLLQDVICALHDDTQIPIELIGNVVLAAASLACQPHIEVIPAHTHQPEPCALYLLTLAESGEGKTTINKKVMKPFYSFAEKMNQEYLERLALYKQKHRSWKVKMQALEGRLRKAIRDEEEGEDEEKNIDALARREPKRPICPVILYEDATPKAFIEGVSEYPEAGLLSDEASTFFKGYLKNNLGLLNKAWDGETYNHRRSDGESHDINPCLTLSLLAQPLVFEDYLKKHGELAKGSGFLSRFLFANTISSIGQRNGNTNFGRSDEALKKLHTRIEQLLDVQRTHFYGNKNKKKTLRLSDEAKTLQAQKRSEAERKIGLNEEWEHIRDIASKSGSNAIRLAAIFTFIQEEDSPQISAAMLGAAYKVIDWHLDQTSMLFYSTSVRCQFEQDIYELFSWLKNKFLSEKGAPVPVNHVEKCGPNRLRRVNILRPLLEQLISMGCICLIRSSPHAATYIAMPALPLNSGWRIPQEFFINGWNPIIASYQNVQGRYDAGNFNQVRLSFY